MQRTVSSCLVVSLLLLQQLLLPMPAGGDPPNQQFLPLVWRQYVGCDLGAGERALLELMRDDPDQARPYMHCNSVLEAVGLAHAQDMAQNDYVGHVNSQGYGSNYRVREAGYSLPAGYGTSLEANDVEVIGVGFDSPAELWDVAMESSTLRTRLLGLTSFYAQQTDYAIVHYQDAESRYEHYWVIITARQ